MTIQVLNEQQVIHEALQVLMANLDLSKVIRFWAASGLGQGDYLQIRMQLFAGESVDSLYDKMMAFEQQIQEFSEESPSAKVSSS